MAPISMNRRIGSRTDVHIPVTLRRQSRGFSRRGRRTDAVITNVSVTGLEIECQPLHDLALHDRLILEIAEGTATAELRRIKPLGNKRVQYGLMFHDMDTPFETAMNQIATGTNNEELDWRWETSR